MSSNSNPPKALPSIHRFITTHDSSGKSCYSKDLDEPLNFWQVSAGEGNSADFELGYVTEGLPIPLANNKDLSTFKEAYANKQKSGLVKHGGSILRYCDIPPGSKSQMHRTVSLDYGILINGELECLLDSGETRTIHPGDVVIQRGTNHQWFNRTEQWARIVFILFHAMPVEINGRALGEDQGGMELPDSH
ncbi:uncharacterized protein FPRO_06877 [Fusarium proliferatum ET1]|uniref:Cupin n=3 Tax=Fusarium fujikuroi species complex TaxID=171627 RepID=A0A8H5YJV4_9HYPO|nr:uncharacterized protein FPRO_06877 [Fusarium proliferatum ET1]KAF5713930.1 cupin [Fusarium globosum]KLO82352.1 Uncharacterized protein LW93_9548 [Fusarium fujikuroi]RBA20624.1 hypothetical protein FPRO05_08071 [Fusarium proliferatum]CZR37932.1 related to Cupin domain protein [Fusarium proliferatum ET1]